MGESGFRTGQQASERATSLPLCAGLGRKPQTPVDSATSRWPGTKQGPGEILLAQQTKQTTRAVTITANTRRGRRETNVSAKQGCGRPDV